MKISSVSHTGLANFMKLFAGPELGLNQKCGSVFYSTREDADDWINREKLPSPFRFIEVLGLKPEKDKGFQIDLKIHFEVWAPKSGSTPPQIYRFENRLLIRTLRALDEKCLPPGNDAESVSKIMQILSESTAYGVCKDVEFYVGEKVVMGRTKLITFHSVMTCLYPHLPELRWQVSGEADATLTGFFSKLMGAKDLAQELR
jgi:hypothetical protein